MFHSSAARNASRSNSVRLRGLFVALAFFTAIAFTQSISAATFTVNTTNDTQDASTADSVCLDAASQCSLRAAITQANALAGDDIINIPAGIYITTLPTQAENLNAGGDFDITSNITINGSGAVNTFIQAAASAGTATERVMHFVTAGTSSLNNVTIRYGRYAANTFGGGARVDTGATATFNGVTVRDNTSAGRGGGVYVNGGTMTMNNSTITANTSGVVAISTSIGGAGLYVNIGTATLNRTTISNNQSVNNSISGTPPSAFGGGVTIAEGTLNLNDSTISGNTASTSIAADAFGGGIGMSMNAGATVVNLTNTSVTGNAVTSSGTGSANVGGIDNEGGTLTLNASTVSNNSAAFTGGLRTFAGAVAATTNINQSAIVNNTTTGGGGGIFNISVGTGAATTNLNNSTVGGNSANGDGGGIRAYVQSSGNGAVNIKFSTIAANTADADGNGGNGGGLANFGNVVAGQTGTSTINLKSSVVGDNNNVGGTSEDIVNTITSQGYNHVENTTLGIFAATTGDVTGTDPGLMAQGLYGGQTPNYLPTSTSPLRETIPSGVSECGAAPFNVDQKNVVRPFDTDFNGTPACEKGASERGLAIITLRNLPNGQRDAPYGTTLVSDYGDDPYTYSLVGGTLPPGLMLNSNGTITGVPTVSGLYTFTVQVQDSQLFAPFARNSKNLNAPAAPNTFQKTFQILILPPTAASLSISGRITTPDGTGLRNARIYLTDAHGNTSQALSTSFGYYRFDDIAAGQSVVITVQSKRYQFEPRVVNVTEDVGDLDFTAAP